MLILLDVLTSSHLIPPVSFLVSRFKDHPQDILRSHLVLGPGNTYIAITPSGILWNVPESLRKMAAGRGYGLMGSENPNKDSLIANAALGQGGAWWVKFRDGSVMWDLAGGYVELQLLLKENTAVHNNINYLALSPFSAQHYFLDYEDNKVRYSLPAGYARLIGPEIDEYHASRVTVSGAHLAMGGASERDADSEVQHSEPPPYSAPKT